MKNYTPLNKTIKNSILRVILVISLVLIGYETARYIVYLSYQKIREVFSSEDMDFKPITVEAEKVYRGSIVRTIRLPGRLTANKKVVLRPEVEGRIKEIHFAGGEAVQKGDLLYVLEDRAFQAQLKEAKAKLVLAKQELERASRLAERNAGTLKQKEKAQADFLEAEANVEISQHRVDHAMIRAPFDGYIGINNISVGAYVNQQTELATIVDSDPIKIDFHVPARYMKQISVGQKVILNVDGFSQDLQAQIVNIDATVEHSVHSIAVRATLDNPRNFLKSGVFARVKLVVGSKDDVLLIPRSSVKSSVDEQYVFRVQRGLHRKTGKPVAFASKTPIVVGLESGETVEVVRGLKEGEQIISVRGLDKIRDHFPVEIIDDSVSDEEDAGGSLEEHNPDLAAEQEAQDEEANDAEDNDDAEETENLIEEDGNA